MADSGACTADSQRSAAHRNSHKFGFKRSRRTTAHIRFLSGIAAIWLGRRRLGASTAINRALIIAHAAHHKLPAVYPYRYIVAGGGLISYGPDSIDQFRHAAGYVNRILKGDNPAGLPVQAPTKYELAINLKTAKALSLAVPSTLLAREDEVVE